MYNIKMLFNKNFNMKYFFPHIKYHKLLEKYTYTKNILRVFVESNLDNFLKKKFNFFII